jgi:3-oxoacid CoA-transferase
MKNTSNRLPIISAPEAVKKFIQNGSTIIIPVFFHVGVAYDLVNAIADQGIKDLSIISNDTGLPGLGTGRLIQNGQVRHMEISYIGTNPEAMQMYVDGKLSIKLTPQGSVVEKLRAGAAGIGFFGTRTGVGTEVEFDKETKIVNGEKYIIEEALRGDVVLVKAYRADRMGNLEFHNTSQNFNKESVGAADVVLVEADEILPSGEYLDPNHIHSNFGNIKKGALIQSSGQWKTDLRVQSAGAMDLSPARELLCKRAALLLNDGDIVNLGIGTPTAVANYIPEDVTVYLMSENGLLHMGPTPPAGQEDHEIINAGRGPASILPGGAFFDSAEAFKLIRAGKVDATILGAFEVDEEGNLANYKIPGKRAPGIGGGMDLVTGAKKVIIATEHIARGKPRIVKRCSLPLTGKGVVDWIVTDLALVEYIKGTGLVLRERAPGVDVKEIIEKTEADLIIEGTTPEMRLKKVPKVHH